jgi:multidrug resistance efflux pump
VASEWEAIHAAAALGEPEMLEVESSEMETHKAEPLESELIEPEVLSAAEPEVAEPEMTEPEQHVPEALGPVLHEVESQEEETLGSESLAASEPAMGEPDMVEPELHEASEAESVALEPQATQPDTVITPEPAVVLEPEMPVVSPVLNIEPDRSSWYTPNVQAAAFTPSAAFDATPDLSALMPSDSNAVPKREEIQVENEIMDSPAVPAVPAAGEEGIVWLATARRDASSRNADRLRKDPMALKPGRLESEHALAEAEAQVLEAKLHAACDGAGAQHRRLEAEFGLKVAQAAVELASKRVEAVGLRERYGAASRAELEHAQLELERAEEELKLARLSEGVAPNIHAGTEPVVNRVEVDAERLKIALQSTPQMLSARHALERAELELAIRDNPAYPASEIASVRNIVNQAREHFSTLEATLHSELEAALASLRYYGARLNERDGAWKSAENELHHAEEGVKQGFVASLTRDEAHLKALRADAERRKAAHKYLEAVHRLQCLTHQHMQ